MRPTEPHFQSLARIFQELKITDPSHSWNIAAKILNKTLAKNPALHKKNNKPIINKIVTIQKLINVIYLINRIMKNHMINSANTEKRHFIEFNSIKKTTTAILDKFLSKP